MTCAAVWPVMVEGSTTGAGPGSTATSPGVALGSGVGVAAPGWVASSGMDTYEGAFKAVIPTRKDQRRNPRFDREAYRRRNVVERCIGWLKECRRLATRHEKLAVNFLAMVKLAMIRRCFKVYDSPDRT